MTDHVLVRDLRVQAHVGVTAAERERPQPLRVSIDAEVDLTRAGRSDDLSETLDYGELAGEVADLVRSTEVALLETVAQQVADHTLRNDRVERVTVEVVKEEPPIDEELGDVAVRIERRRT